ncbi:response regulator transcription factor [Halobellus rubicundus]|uniref:Response regulator transcription factor n=1 Tax=Halobellus rubicundus TaxID=2996466 RepID=A0ABD5MAX2_9EURY
MSQVAVVADDDSTIRSLLQHKLSSSGFSVQLCEDGQAARDTLDTMETDPDVVVLDVMMPRLSGIQLLRAIRRGEVGVDEDVPVVMLTSRGREADVLDGLQSGSDDYITKPFSPNELLARIRKVLDE